MNQLYLLGSFELHADGKEIHLPTRKMESLLAYLVLHPGNQNREKLAALFWGDSPDELARRSLRTALSVIRKELGDDSLLTDRETVQLNPRLPLWVDVRELEKQAAEVLSTNHHGSVQMDLDLYRGDLLRDFYDDWGLEDREEYRNRFISAFNQLTQTLKTKGDYSRVIMIAQKIISLDPVNERAYQHLIFSYGALGHRIDALKTYDECVHQLQEQLGIEPSRETVQLYEQVKSSDVSTTNEIQAKSNLPIPLTSFIGRQHELKTLKEIFGTTRLLTLTGVGGCGKTRLAIELAGLIGEPFTDGVWWMELASIQDETALIPTILKTLGLADSETDSAEEALLKFLRPRHALLIMDNCEHVILAVARLVETILRQCPQIKILATSREALSIHGEIAWQVPSLSLPPLGQVDDILRWECPRLFLERALSYRSDLQLTEANAKMLLRICRALEGIPLAIELAAARVRSLSIEQLAARLDDKLSLLTTGSRTAQLRQQTLRAAIDWSYELLSKPEQIILQRLSVFYGTWTLEAAEYVCSDETIPSNQILDLITHLLEKSLIVAEPQDSMMRYRMLEIIRQYAMEKMEQMVEVQKAKDRTMRYFAELAQSQERAWYSKEQSRLIKQFDIEYPNLRAALTWGLSDPKRSSNWEYGVKLAFALTPCWNLLAQLNEGLGWLKKVRDQADALLAEAEGGSNERLLSIKAKAMYEYAALSYYLTMHAAAIDLFEESARIYQELGDEIGLAYPNLYIAQAAENQGQKDLARRIWLQSLEQFHRVGDLWYAAMVHSFLGWLERGMDDYDTAAREFYSAINLYNQIGDEWGMSIMLSHLGVSEFQQGHPEQAREFFERRLAIARKNGFRHSIAYATLLIGITYWKSGDDLRVETCIREAIPVFPQIGNYIGLVDCVVGMAWVAARRDDLERAAFLLGAAEKANQTYGRKYFFEYDYFYQPIRNDLLARFGSKYEDALEKGRNADFDEVVKNLLQSEMSS